MDEYVVTVEYGGLVMGEWKFANYEEALKMYHYAMMQRKRGTKVYMITLFSAQPSHSDTIIHQYIYHAEVGAIVDI